MTAPQSEISAAYAEAAAYGFPSFPPDVLAERLSSPPFIPVEGVINMRDIGGYPSSIPCPTSGKPQVVKKSLLFRCGEPSKITEKGKNMLRELGIKRVFDFRTDDEVKKWIAPVLDIDGLQVVRVGVVEMTSWDDMRTEAM
jgi:hypothetical protein